MLSKLLSSSLNVGSNQLAVLSQIYSITVGRVVWGFEWVWEVLGRVGQFHGVEGWASIMWEFGQDWIILGRVVWELGWVEQVWVGFYNLPGPKISLKNLKFIEFFLSYEKHKSHIILKYLVVNIIPNKLLSILLTPK